MLSHTMYVILIWQDKTFPLSFHRQSHLMTSRVRVRNSNISPTPSTGDIRMVSREATRIITSITNSSNRNSTSTIPLTCLFRDEGAEGSRENSGKCLQNSAIVHQP